MSITQEMLDALLAHLRAHFDKQLAVEFFPDSPGRYRLNHPVGAVLVGYAASRFEASQSLDRIMQPREMSFAVTLVSRRLHGAQGAVPYLDSLRSSLIGLMLPHCQMGLIAATEAIVGQSESGLWHYRQEYTTSSMQIQVEPAAVGLPLVAVDFEEDQS